MKTTTNLQNAFRFHLQGVIRRAYGDTRPRAILALELARADMAAGKDSYPLPAKSAAVYWQESRGIAHVESVDGCGLRLVGEVNAESRRSSVWNTRSDKSGWYTDPHGDVFRDGTGLCWGAVYQLPARNGKARFVAGYEFGGTDSGPTVDFGHIYESDWNGDNWNVNPRDIDAAIDAARAADSMAERAAESEREYQSAWQAGRMFAELGADIATTRKALLAMLAERRAAKANALAYPAICAALRDKVAAMLDDIGAWRSKRADLECGDADEFSFYPSTELRAAFADGAAN
jgi:hypothetical protein